MASLTEYDPFGQVIRHEKYGSDFATAWYYFTGKPLDDETGLIFLGSRYYNPKLGRFITPDTIVPNPSQPQNLNRYTYAGNNPVNFTDPSGHKKKKHHGFLGFVQKVSGYLGFAGTLINDAISGDWSQIGRQIAVAAISAVSSFLLPGFGTLSANLFINIGLHAAIGAAEGAVIGGISSVIMGGTFGSGALAGAIGGSIGGSLQGITTSQQFQNWQNGKGFVSNADAHQANLNRPQNNPLNVDSNNNGDSLLDNSKVRAEMNKRWFESHPYNDNLRAEDGAWIVKNQDGSIGFIERGPAGAQQAEINMWPEPDNTIAVFHVHPNVGPQWVQGPSNPWDFDFARVSRVKNYVVSEKLIYSYNGDNNSVHEYSRW